MIPCICCSMIRENGQPRPPRPAAYWWTGPNGYPQPICEDCCGWWLIGSLDDPDMGPQAIEFVALGGVR